MKLFFKPAIFAVNIIAAGLTTSAIAQPTLFNFTLTVNDVSNPKIFVGRNPNPLLTNKDNTFKVDVKPSDYVFKVQYHHEGKPKEAVCTISGTPKHITATIDPTKDGTKACTTEEFSREYS